MSYWAAFGLTLAVEAPLAALLSGDLRRRAAFHSLLLNLATHPLAYLALRRGWSSWTLAELLVAASEAVGFAVVTRLGWPRALLVSAACNGATAGLAFLLP